MFESGIVYSLVSKGDETILSSYSSTAGNLQTIALKIIKQIDKTKTYCQIKAESYNFFTFIKDGFIFLAAADSSYQARIALTYLRKIQEKFFDIFNVETRNSASAPLEEFDEILRKQMQAYADKTKVDKLSQLKKELAVLQQNFHKKLNQKNNGHII